MTYPSDEPAYDVIATQESVDQSNMEYVASELHYCYNLLFNGAERPEEIRMENHQFGAILMVTQTINTGQEDEKVKNRINIMGGNLEHCWRELAQFFVNNPEAHKRLSHYMSILPKQQPAPYIQFSQ